MINKNILVSCSKHGFDESDLYGAYKIFFGTLFSDSRLKILNALRKQTLNVSELTKKLGLEQTATSHDLARLKKCGFVTQTIKGKYRYYSINEETIKPVLELIDDHMSKHCIHILKKDSKK